jgi:cytochrome b subunit of formate dehydrogenase/mono/diheme cytochrome c family protein
MLEPAVPTPAAETPAPRHTYPRFERSQRLEHAVFLTAFTVLAVTGLAQKFAANPVGGAVLAALGGIETARLIHRTAAVVMMAESIYHLVAVLYRTIVRRVALSMLPTLDDLRHLLQDLAFNLGLRKARALPGRYSYVEKAEYFALVWGTLIMILTGFMMWNPIATASLLPGEAIPAAKSAHGNEAVLAVLAILLWHFYHVHLRHFNRSMFTGVLTREEMEHEHPAELEAIEAGRIPPPPTPELIRKREVTFLPGAALLAAALGFGLLRFVTFEQTAITTVPPGESADPFVPQTPTPAPTLAVTPTLSSLQPASWTGRYEGLFRDRCGSCHGITSVGGLSLAEYATAIQGGNSGPGIVPGDPQASWVVRIQSQGGHPGQLTSEELAALIEWIEAGAPEQ